MDNRPLPVREYNSMVNEHYEAAKKLAEMETKEKATDLNIDEKGTLREQLERTEAELTEFYEELEPEQFHHLCKCVLQ